MSETSASIRVLYVDDEPTISSVVADLLEREDDRLTVETAASASEAIDRLAETDVHCIVSDYDMPGQNGIEFLETVRERDPDLPFILFTGKGSEEVASEAISTGVTDYLQKETGTEQYTLLANRIRNSVVQYRAVRELETTRERFDKLLAESSDFIFIVDEAATIQYITPSVERVMGYTPDEMVGQDGFVHVHPDDTAAAQREFLEVLDDPRSETSTEFRSQHADGSWRWLEVRARNLLDDPVIEGIVVNVRDVTERKTRERESQRYERIIQEMNDGVVVVQDGRIRETNPEIASLTGYSAADLRDRPMGEFIAPAYRDTVEQRFRERISGGDPPKTYEIAICTRDGEEVPVEITVARVRYGEDPATVSIVRDISDRKARERALERRNERLDEFATIVSHDLRNPLTVASGKLELARRDVQSEHLEAVERALDRMHALIEDLLALAREGETVATAEPVDLESVVECSWRTVATDQATLVVETDRTIRADAGRLQQLFENLIRNAIEHGGSDITVTVGELADGSGIFIEDDGPGIPDAEGDRVFESGYSTRTGGSGIGLSIVEQVVDMHDWDIRVTAGADGGARFEITDVPAPST